MESWFNEIADETMRIARGGEVVLVSIGAEQSDFVRFNHGSVRQPGSVTQRTAYVRLIDHDRQAIVQLELQGGSEDCARLRSAIDDARGLLIDLPPDPHILYSTTVQSSASHRAGKRPDSTRIVASIVEQARALDLVGIYSAGTIYRGFANSLGQRNWHGVETFNFDWSLHDRADKAVKASYAGFDWDPGIFQTKLRESAAQLTLMKRPSRQIAPGEYRAYLAPQAVDEVMGLLGWGGFSAHSMQTKWSPLLRMTQGEHWSERVTIVENTIEGSAPAFQGEGFTKPDRVPLVSNGKLDTLLVAPRTAMEFNLVANGAGAGEKPESLDLHAGMLAMRDVLASLDTGIYINNLWYLNYSDRSAGRMTGMTRFATLWVEHGRIVGPIDVMRFDDTLARMLGENLIDLTVEREMLLDPSTYDARSTSSARLPGILLEALRFTL
ncbi:MAG: metallopeptidase TldD-related protein [Burkholderiales bacterium]